MCISVNYLLNQQGINVILNAGGIVNIILDFESTHAKVQKHIGLYREVRGESEWSKCM
jgi:hypothetical protein